MALQITGTNGARDGMDNAPITIKPPAFQTLTMRVQGSSPYVQARFGAKAMQAMADKMKAGTTAKKNTAKPPRDFDEDYRQALHVAEAGWYGIPAAAFRNAAIDACRMAGFANAAIDACRMAGFAMTRAKMSVFIQADGLDVVDGTPLVRIIGGEPERTTMAVRNASGVADLRVRPMWRTWEVLLTATYDADQFTPEDVINLMARAGLQVGVGEGRPFSKSSNGLGFGLFMILNQGE